MKEKRREREREREERKGKEYGTILKNISEGGYTIREVGKVDKNILLIWGKTKRLR